MFYGNPVRDRKFQDGPDHHDFAPKRRDLLYISRRDSNKIASAPWLTRNVFLNPAKQAYLKKRQAKDPHTTSKKSSSFIPTYNSENHFPRQTISKGGSSINILSA